MEMVNVNQSRGRGPSRLLQKKRVNTNEERVSLMNGRATPSSSPSTGNTLDELWNRLPARWKRIFLGILVGCLLLFLWEEVLFEQDASSSADQKSAGAEITATPPPILPKETPVPVTPSPTEAPIPQPTATTTEKTTEETPSPTAAPTSKATTVKAETPQPTATPTASKRDDVVDSISETSPYLDKTLEEQVAMADDDLPIDIIQEWIDNPLADVDEAWAEQHAPPELPGGTDHPPSDAESTTGTSAPEDTSTADTEQEPSSSETGDDDDIQTDEADDVTQNDPTNTSQATLTPIVTTPPKLPYQQPLGDCQQRCQSSSGNNNNVDLSSAAIMLKQFQTARSQYNQQLKQDYGKYYDAIFFPAVDKKKFNVGRHEIFQEPMALPLPGHNPDQMPGGGPGWERMVRKYTIKLLQIQLGYVQTQLSGQNPYCQSQCELGVNSTNDIYSQFMWINGGHSASAGHGNFYRESYTANLGRDLQPIFQAIGLDFQVKNYAMGGTDSGEEVALCSNQIFGRGIDSISWDYGMTDGRGYYKMALYAYRAARRALLQDSLSQPGNIRHRPSFIAINHNDDFNWLLRHLQDLGMTVLGEDTAFMNTVIKSAFPDMFGMSDAEIEALPPYVKYMKCNDDFEAGDPGCKDHKYNLTYCPNRRAMASWHPGYKWHALMGHLLANTVLEVVSQSLREMIKKEATPDETLEQKEARLLARLQELDTAEQLDYEAIFSQPVPEQVAGWFDDMYDGKEVGEAHKQDMKDHGFDLERFIKAPAMCHTAMLPAEIRYTGILTENFKEVGTVLDQKYEQAVGLKEIKEVEFPDPTSGKTASVYIPRDHPDRATKMILAKKEDEHDICDYQTNADFKDYFVVTSGETGFRGLDLPNQSELDYYTEFDAANSIGWIFLCMSRCDWGNCQEGDIRDSIVEGKDMGEYGKLEIDINLVKVSGVDCMHMCCMLKHGGQMNANPLIWKNDVNKGAYHFRARIVGAAPDKFSYARFSSIIFL